MRKDYAKNIFIAQRRSNKRSTRFSAIVIVFLTAFVISTSAFWIYKHNGIKESMTIVVSELKTLMGRKNSDPLKTTKTAVNPANANTEDKPIRFDFYTELPKMQVNVPNDASQKNPSSSPAVNSARPGALAFTGATSLDKKSKAAPPTNQFILQLGVFKDEISANQLRLSLLLSGIETDVIKLENRTYRVQKGPFASTNQAKSMQRRLNKKGFDSDVRPL